MQRNQIYYSDRIQYLSHARCGTDWRHPDGLASVNETAKHFTTPAHLVDNGRELGLSLFGETFVAMSLPMIPNVS